MMNFPSCSCSCACAVDIATASASTANRSSWYMVLSAHVAQLISSCRGDFVTHGRRSPLAAHVGGLVTLWLNTLAAGYALTLRLRYGYVRIFTPALTPVQKTHLGIIPNERPLLHGPTARPPFGCR